MMVKDKASQLRSAQPWPLTSDGVLACSTHCCRATASKAASVPLTCASFCCASTSTRMSNERRASFCGMRLDMLQSDGDIIDWL
jgi:hypothetical protein